MIINIRPLLECIDGDTRLEIVNADEIVYDGPATYDAISAVTRYGLSDVQYIAVLSDGTMYIEVY